MPARQYPSLDECLQAAAYWRGWEWLSSDPEDARRCRRLREEWIARAQRASRWLREGRTER